MQRQTYKMTTRRGCQSPYGRSARKVTAPTVGNAGLTAEISVRITSIHIRDKDSTHRQSLIESQPMDLSMRVATSSSCCVLALTDSSTRSK